MESTLARAGEVSRWGMVKVLAIGRLRNQQFVSQRLTIPGAGELSSATPLLWTGHSHPFHLTRSPLPERRAPSSYGTSLLGPINIRKIKGASPIAPDQ